MYNPFLQDTDFPHNSIQTMRQLHMKMWTLPNCDGGIVCSYFTNGLGSLLRTSPRYWGVMKLGWQERCILPSCPSTFCIYSPKESSFKNLPCGSHFLSRFLRYLLKFVLSPYGRCIYCVGGGGGGGRIFSCRMKKSEIEANSSLRCKFILTSKMC